MKNLEVVASRIFSAADILEDQTYAERGDIITMPDAKLGSVKMQGVVPMLHQRPGSVWRTGPDLGQDNELVYGTWLGYDSDKLATLDAQGVI